MAALGLIVNPIAGMGGRVGLKGTDGADVVARARALGADARAPPSAPGRALARLELRSADVRLVAAPGAMGADVAAAHGRSRPRRCSAGAGASDEADDGRRHARRGRRARAPRRRPDALRRRRRHRARHPRRGRRRDVPILGIPTGVKMHSGVFATTPEAAGDVAASFLAAPARGPAARGRGRGRRRGAVRAGAIATRLYGAARVPDDRLRVQAAKAGTAPSDEAALDAVCAAIADGAGSAPALPARPRHDDAPRAAAPRAAKTLLGVDAVAAGGWSAPTSTSASSSSCSTDEPATLVVGVVGGQGALLGRGNQQLSPAVIRRIGAENIEIVAGLRQARSPSTRPCCASTPATRRSTRQLCGYRRVHVAPAA